jgi:hypothetical protein
MLIRVTCPCGYVGIATADGLPRELTCLRCGEARQVAAAECRPVRSREAVMEMILGSTSAATARKPAGAPSRRRPETPA